MLLVESKKRIPNAYIDFIAGSLGGVCVVFIGQPLDTVKVKMQTFPKLYKNMFDCTRQTLKTDGLIRGLYAGTVPAIVASVAENSVLFAAYGHCQRFVCLLTGVETAEKLSVLGNATSGFFAAFFSALTLCPTELIKCKLQSIREAKLIDPKNAVKITPFQLTRQIWREHGIQGLYRGMVSTWMREMPGYFFFFGGYEGARELLRKPGQSKDDIGLVRTMIAGAIGGMIIWTVIFPSDVIKSRIQISKQKNLKFFNVGADIIRKEGLIKVDKHFYNLLNHCAILHLSIFIVASAGVIRAVRYWLRRILLGVLMLFNGLKPTLVRAIPVTAMLFLIVEYSKRWMSEYFD